MNFFLQHYKPIIGSLAGAYILGKVLLPENLFDYVAWKKQKSGMDRQEALLKQIASNSEVAAVPKKDNYIYTF